MLKTTLLVCAAAMSASAVTLTYVGRTTYSSPFQVDFPLSSAIKVTPDPGNVWSWHHEFVNQSGWQLQTADVLVDIDGDQVMDTVHDVARVMITDLQLVGSVGQVATARIIDSGGKRLAVGIGGFQTSGAVQHINLTTPIVLPVGSFLHVELIGDGGATCEVNLVGRIVNP